MPRTATGRLIGTETERRSEPETKTQILAAGVTDDAVSPSTADCRRFSDNNALTQGLTITASLPIATETIFRLRPLPPRRRRRCVLLLMRPTSYDVEWRERNAVSAIFDYCTISLKPAGNTVSSIWFVAILQSVVFIVNS